MRFLRLLKYKLGGKGKSFGLLIVLSASSAALILAVLNLSMSGSGHNDIYYAVAFIVLLACFVFLQYKILNKGWETAEEIADDFRSRLSFKILNADLISLEKIGDREIYERLTLETANISQSAGFLIPSLQIVILMFFIMVYLAVIFPAGMAAFAVLILIGIYLYRSSSRGIMSILKRATRSELRFYGFLNDIIKGIKEIKFLTLRKTELLSDIKSNSSFLRKLKQKSYSDYSDLSIYSQAFFFLIIGVVVFVMPGFDSVSTPVVIKLITSAFFIMAPMLGIMFMLPMFENIDLSLEYLENLEEKLESAAEMTSSEKEEKGPKDFENLEVKGLKFAYGEVGNDGFNIGPVDLSIDKGEIIFFTGGNGSGKTTLLKVISSLYKKTDGEIFINGRAVRDENLEGYRSHFSAIFSDFHLFAKLYGFDNPDIEKINELLTLMRIENKTSLRGNSFTNINLSTGQKKRLALVVSLLEDKPVLIFDEWAAEQDQYFREYFYKNILPELKRNGKTVLVVSHDERYFGSADKLVKMDFGQISEIRFNNSAKNIGSTKIEN